MKAAILIVGVIVFLSSSTNAQQTTYNLEKRDTVFITSEQVEVLAEIGTLMVPENRQSKKSRLIAVNYVRLKSTSANPKEPLIYLEGGGSPSTWQAQNPDRLSDWMLYLEVSDVILYDQRGTTDEGLLWIWDAEYPESFLISDEAAGIHWRAMGAKALRVFEKRGVDVRGYNVAENACDIEALRQALNIEKISILGFSYGTTLGLTFIKLYGDHISNAVLAGVDGLDQSFNYPSVLDAHFGRISDLVAENEVIQTEVPNLVKLLDRVMSRLENQPMEVDIQNPLTGEPMRVKVGSFGLALILRLDLDDATDLPIIPRLLYSIDNGEISVLKWFVQKRVVFAFAIPGNGLTQGIASSASKTRLKRIDKEAKESIFKNVVNFPFYDMKDFWPEVKLEVNLTKPLVSNVRVLLLSGDLDYRTPPQQAEEIKNGFSNASHLVLNHAGHEQVLPNPDIRSAIQLFLKGRDVSDYKVTHKGLEFIPVTGTIDSSSHPSITD